MLIQKTSSIITKLRLILFPPRIANMQDYEEFLYDFSTRAAGGLVLSYAQKRAGKLHFRLAKEKDYADELIKAQIGIHAEIVSDLWFLTMQFTQMDGKSVRVFSKSLLSRLHQRYVATVPYEGDFGSALSRSHFTIRRGDLRELAQASGDILFSLLPLTEGLRSDNREVFRGQLRLRYIRFFEILDGRLDRGSFSESVKSLGI